MEKQYVAYYRLSKQGKRLTGLGIEAQQQIVNHFYKPVKEFTEIKSGSNITERPVLKEAILYCLKYGYTLVTAKVDRLSRNVDDCRYVLAQLKGNLCCCDIPGTVDKFTLTLYAAFAERERELIALRTSQALRVKVRNEGQWRKASKAVMNGTASKKGAAGMKARALNNENNKRAASVISSKFAEGYTYTNIVEHLNANAFKTARGNAFTITQVQRLKQRYC